VTQHEHPFHYYRSPEEIREVQFSHRVRGLDEYEVAEYLDLLADQVHATNLELRRLRDERDRLRMENEHLRAEGPRTPIHASVPSSPEAMPQAASLLLNAQKVADDLVEEAVRRARDMLTVARAEKNAILRNAKEEAAALLVEAREATSSSLSTSPLHSSYSSTHSAPSSHSTHSAPAVQPTPMHLAPQRTWQLDGHAAV
jgi:DivIVA domain-containing protein